MIFEGIRLTNDYVFKKIFEDKYVLCDFVSAIIDEPIVSLAIKNSEILPPYIGDKLGRLDILAETDRGEKINVEMQLEYRPGFDDRTSFYGMRLHSSQIKEGEKYRDMKRTIVINILDFEHPSLRGREGFHTIFKLLTPDGAVTLTDKFVIHFIEVPKMPQETLENLPKLGKWILFLSNKGGSEVIEVLEREPMIAKAMMVADLIAKDERERMIAQAREDAIRDQIWRETTTAEDWLEDGIAIGEQRGERRGKQEGIALGKREGIALGKQEGIATIVRFMAQAHNSPEQISSATGLPEREVREILKGVL